MKKRKLEYDIWDLNAAKRRAVEETEERLALDWKDIELIDCILKELRKYHKYKHPYYEDVLSEFNRYRRKK